MVNYPRVRVAAIEPSQIKEHAYASTQTMLCYIATVRNPDSHDLVSIAVQ